jgi:hypothetical protein
MPLCREETLVFRMMGRSSDFFLNTLDYRKIERESGRQLESIRNSLLPRSLIEGKNDQP